MSANFQSQVLQFQLSTAIHANFI